MTLRTNRIEVGDGSSGVSTDYVVNGSAKAWANLNWGVSLRDSFNVSSYTDVSNISATVNLTNSMAVADEYVVQNATNNNTTSRTSFTLTSEQTVHTLDTGSYTVDSNIGDVFYSMSTVFGDLA